MARRLTPDIIATHARLRGVPEALALAVAQQESGFKTAAVSPLGAVGAFQVMPDTFKKMMPGGNIDDPIDNMEAGLKYLKQGLDQGGGDPEKALQFYYSGRILRPGEDISGGKGFPTTRAYPKQVLARMRDFERQGYGTATAAATTPPLAQLATPRTGATSTEPGTTGLTDALFGTSDLGRMSQQPDLGRLSQMPDLGRMSQMPDLGRLAGSNTVGSFAGGPEEVAMNEAGSQDYELDQYIRQMVDEELGSENA